jgi:N-acetylglucosaminyldiphosphoundecaprenol N-acetyl-beta-D-mannosaminyltransferase
MVDFNRNVHCLLGLPFDAVSLPQAARRLERARSQGQRCFLSTPNLNFVISSLRDPAFRASVCRSNLSLADGMPLVWVARLLGIPVRERVSGSGVFDFLRTNSPTLWNVFFFGGQMGRGQEACLAIGDQEEVMRPAGYIYPGFGDIEQMSRTELIDCINSSGADMLVVSLGASKGQSWILHNLEGLTTPVISHLGAVVNFVAGSVSRAPRWMQRTGLEWLWRIKEEPQLFRRYLNDGLGFLRLMATQVLPLAVLQRVGAPAASEFERANLSHPQGTDASFSRLAGAWRQDNLTSVRGEFDRLLARGVDATLDMADVTSMDSAFIGLMLLLDEALTERGAQLRVINLNPRLRRLLRLHGVHHLALQ